MHNYLHRMLEMLTGAYNRDDVHRAKWGQPPETNIGKLFSLHASALNLTHDHTDKVLLWDNIDNAQGNVLDRYGENFGVAREGSPDAFYRLLIKVKMLSQLSGGDIDTVTRAAATLLDVKPEQVELEEIFPAKVWIYVDRDELGGETVQLIDLIWRMIHRIVAAGIWLKLLLRVYSRHRYNVLAHNGAMIETTAIAYPPCKMITQTSAPTYHVGAYITTTITARTQPMEVSP